MTEPKQSNGLRYGPLSSQCTHLCVDMQRMFADRTDWHTPWMNRVVPKIIALVEHRPDRTVFTRFIPAACAGDRRGTWRRYYERWSSMTRERLGTEMIGLLPEFDRFVPPARILDKAAYSPWFKTDLDRLLAESKVEELIVSGGETDVCVLAAVLGAVDRGYRVVIAADALCSSCDETHDSLMTLYATRYGQQIELVETAEIIESWR